jgi:4-hydroxybenzoate polyprenyltransferase
MKRITWWPQAWLGLVFSWGALVGWPAVTGGFETPALLLWLGSIFWVIGYDTLYAIQDIEDDELVGVKSSARALGERAQLGVGICYALALAGWAAAIWSARPDWLALLALLPGAAHLAMQVAKANPKDGAAALHLFRSNRFTGLLLFLGFLAVGLSSFE